MSTILPRRTIPLACLDFEKIGHLLHSYAFAVALQRHTSLEWKEYKESTVLNIAYALLPWKEGPGYVEVNQNMRQAREDAKQVFEHCVSVFLRKLSEGPCALMQYLSELERLKGMCLAGVQETFASAREINAQVVGETNTAIRRLAAVKAAATITLAGMSGGVVLAGGSVALVAGAGAVSFGYSVTGAVVKNWGELKMAGALAIEIGKEYVPKNAGELMQGVGTAALWAASPKWNEARAKVSSISRDLARKISSRKQAKLGRQLTSAQADLAQAEMQASRGMKVINAGKNIVKFAPVVFAAVDIYGAIDEYGTDTAGAR